jgi:hypothetical protein
MKRRQWVAQSALGIARSVLGIGIVALAVTAGCDLRNPGPKVTSVNLRTSHIVDSPNKGQIDAIELRGGKWVAYGWAMNGDTRGKVDAVVIANQKRDVLAFEVPDHPRPDVVKVVGVNALANAGFEIELDPAQLVGTETNFLAAYAYSGWDNRAVQQNNTFNVRIEKGRVVAITLNPAIKPKK